MMVFLGPTEEKIGMNPFLPYSIERLKKEAEPVPLMAGICEGEGYMFILGEILGTINFVYTLCIDYRQFD